MYFVTSGSLAQFLNMSSASDIFKGRNRIRSVSRTGVIIASLSSRAKLIVPDRLDADGAAIWFYFPRTIHPRQRAFSGGLAHLTAQASENDFEFD